MGNGERPKRRSMVRSLVPADFVTLGNAAAGTAALFMCLLYVEEREALPMWVAIGLFPVALACDVLDGFVARWRGRQSPYGGDLDSLADVISFGVAPACLAFALGMRGGWDVLVLIYFVACGVARLARFNVTASALADERGKVKYFEGTPIPTSVLLVGVLAVAFGMGEVNDQLWLGGHRLGPWLLHPLVLMYALMGTTMISSTLKIPKP
ncbi:MAG: CDP-alcohol phosphatidyltransferase family protein [Myxococcota bacterium]